jgi:radical SAM superfamily enzyme YgiQ (UPF0313 family)
LVLNKKNGGYKVVLTADRTLMSEYAGGIFLGFSACIPRGLMPDKLYFSLFCPSVPVNKDGSSKYAPCGIRKTEALLLNNGFSREDVIVAHPDYLDKVVGENTKVLGINETDPLGMGPATSTFTQMFRLGEAYMTTKFKEILNNPAVQKYNPKIIMGGPGAWQLEDDVARRGLGVDCVVVGEAEKVAGGLFNNAAKGVALPEVVHSPVAEEADIPCIQGGTIDGIIEIARGCGRGCAFCVPTLQRYRCLSIEHILKEVDVNLAAGRRPLLHAEDVLRYKAKGFEINEEAVKELFGTVYHHPGVKAVGISHFALSSVSSAPDLIKDLSEILDVRKDGEWFGGQCGVETGSPKLIGELMAGKAKPFSPEEWPKVVVDAFQTLNENNWVPCATLIIGLPGETEEDVELTMDLVARLHEYKSLLVPLFMVSEGGLKDKAKSFKIEDISHKQAELFLQCWEHDLDWAQTFLNEYFVMKAHWGKGYAMKQVFNYGVKQAKSLLKTCKEDYDYNMPAMITDARNGKFSLSLPLRIIMKVMSMRGSDKNGETGP